MNFNVDQPKKFLIIDDDTDDSELFAEALTAIKSATVCYCAGDGEEAIQKLSEKEIEKPDMIFLDINMPVMDGWDCLSKLKSTDQFKDIPVIMHTTSSLKNDKDLARKLGALCFITKQSDFQILKRMLEIVVNKMTKQEYETLCQEVYRSLNLAN